MEPFPPGGIFAGPRSLGIDEVVRIADNSSSIPRIYFVASADAATDVLNRIAEENRLRFSTGTAEFHAKVVVVGSDEQAVAYAGSLQDSDAIRAELGAPPYEIIDLRSAETAAPTPIACPRDGLSTAAPTGGMTERYCEQAHDSRQEAGTSTATPADASAGVAVYLVTSQAEADWHRQLGLHAKEIMLAAGTTEEYARADAMLRELTLHLGDGRVRVIDLRTPSDTSLGQTR